MEVIFFCFMKEELRESWEEPTDPQAQQEIINSIEEVYFSNDAFDIVKYELEVSYFCKRKGNNITKNEGQKQASVSDALSFKTGWFCLFLFPLPAPESSCSCMEHVILVWSFFF